MNNKEEGEKICFVISPIGEQGSDIRKNADDVFKYIITPCVEKYGYKPIRADHIDAPGIITSQVIQYIVDSPLIIADLSEKNPNVFYELAIRHAIKKPLIQIIKKGDSIPFDVAATRIIHFDTTDLDSVDETKKNIESQIDLIDKDNNGFDNPISIAIDLQNFKGSNNPEQRSLADIISGLAELRSSFNLVEQKLNKPEKLLPQDYLENIARRIIKVSQVPNEFFIGIDEITQINFKIMDIRSLIQDVLNRGIEKTTISDLRNLLSKIEMLNFDFMNLNQHLNNYMR